MAFPASNTASPSAEETPLLQAFAAPRPVINRHTSTSPLVSTASVPPLRRPSRRQAARSVLLPTLPSPPSPTLRDGHRPPAASSAAAALPSAVRRPRAAPQLGADGDSLETTPQQVALVAADALLNSAVVLRALVAGGVQTLPANLLAAIAAYLLSDFAIAVYHHAVDNYGSERTPVFGYQIAAFQGHHVAPWTITNRGLANNLFRLTIPLLPQLGLLLVFDPLPPAATVFYASFLASVLFSQETHRQAHMLRPAPWARKLQDAGLIVSRTAHAKHHCGAFDGHYGILSGISNPVLDRTRFFRAVEATLFLVTAVEPICWRLEPVLKEEALRMLPPFLRRRRLE